MNIQNLVFFKTDGSQIPIQFTNNITFTVIGNMSERFGRGYGWREDAKGYISLDESSKVVGLTMVNKGSTYGFNDSTDYTSAVHGLVDEIQVTIKTDDYEETISFLKDGDLNNVFEFSIGKREISVKSETTDKDNLIYEYFVESVSVKDEWKSKLFQKPYVDEETGETVITKFHIPEGTKVYPCQQFMSQVFMEKVSTNLVSTETIFVLEKRKNSKGEEGFFRPRSNTQNLRFQFSDESDTRVVKTVDEFYSQDRNMLDVSESEYDYSKVYWSTYATFNLIKEYEETEDSIEPLFFTMGFVSEYEGCFQDTLNIKTVDGILGDADLEFNTIGYMMVKNETVAEDERFRTLFTNFGIPDPADYQHVFKDTDIMEEENDWDFINKKSKELFLSYKDIFPYVGTYKALLNAVKFLGYDDIYFKEWYKFYDGINEDKISYQSVDVNLMIPLQSKLERLGVSLEDFINWKKLSQLSLVYLINQQDSDNEVIESYTWENGKKTNISRKTFAIPSTKPVYTYLNTQILAKLYSLKEWLETYILNINCKIIDVAGEGIYFERYKSQAHVAPLYTNFTAVKESNITPVFSNTRGDKNTTLEFGRSSVDCTIKELEDNLTFSDYEGTTYMDYLKKTEGVSEEVIQDKDYLNEYINWLKSSDTLSEEEVVGWSQINMRGTSFDNNTPFDGIQYELHTSVDSGSFRNNVGYYDSSDNFVECPLVVKDNEIFIYGNRQKEVEFKKLPVIRIASGKLRKTFGKWDRNTLYNIQGYFDTERTKSRFVIQSAKNNSQVVSDDYITLYPRKGEDVHPYVKYTEKNKYGIPMFIIQDYDTYNGYIASDCSVNKFIVEIGEGYIDSFEIAEGEDDNICIARLEFEQDYDRNNANEQKVRMNYIYRTPRASLEYSDVNREYNPTEYIEKYTQKMDLNDKNIIDVSNCVFETSVYSKDSSNPLLSDFELKSIKDNYSSAMTVADKSISNIENRISRIETLIEDCSANDYPFKKLYLAIYQNELNQRKNELEDEIEARDSIEETSVESFEELKSKWLEILETRKKNIAKDLNVEVIDARNRVINRKYHETVVLNHIGEYDMTAIATDAYNIPYAQKSTKKVTENMIPPTVFVNTYTEEDSLFETCVEEFDAKPWFVPEYFRTVKNVDEKESSLTYEDYSYYMDTPKKGEFVHLSNTTEKVDDIDDEFDAKDVSIAGFEYDKSRVYIKIVLNDENPCNQNIYFKGAELYLTFIDRNSCDIANFNNEIESNLSKISGPFRVDAYYNPNFSLDEHKVIINEEDESEENNNYLVLSYDPTDLDFVAVSKTMIELMSSQDIFCYANLHTRIDIDLENISNDSDNRQCTIKIKDRTNGQNIPFSKGQSVKIFYSALTYMGTNNDTNIVKEKYISGTSYKILDAHYDASSFTQTFVINGLINTDLIEMRKFKNGIYNHISDEENKNFLGVPYKIRCTISPSHWMYTNYDVKVVEDADEDNSEGYFKFEDDWFGSEYLDNTFAFTTRQFKVNDAFNDWKTDFVKEDRLFAHIDPVIEYREDDSKPVSVMVNSFDLDNSFDDGEYSCIWNVYYNAGKEIEDEYLLYQLTNDQLVLDLKNDGEYRFQLTAIDKFGNAVTNKKQGFLKVVTR